ncbi:DMT family transporter [Cohnella nanjingensis]|uniref:DMT family transporter n=1 Tax=Cohnella nanjingensis TaxID=1387779 RepID=A0A7X0VFD6_9BACL|nr:DMT family transporter [Cohnella nanjingensis]MBB6671950.1 DMT family transporter [Cohnella nanjingensis]
MNGYGFSLLIAFLTGLLSVAQGAINASIGRGQGQYVMIIGVSLIQILAASLLLRISGSPQQLTAWFHPGMIVSGLLGVGIMFGVSKATGTAGALPVFVTAVAGQIAASAAMDHWGLMGLPRSPFTLQKLGSVLVIAAGIYWLLKSQPN